MSLTFLIVAASNITVGYLLAVMFSKPSREEVATSSPNFNQPQPAIEPFAASHPEAQPAADPLAAEALPAAETQNTTSAQRQPNAANANAEANETASAPTTTKPEAVFTFHGALENPPAAPEPIIDAVANASQLLDTVDALVQQECPSPAEPLKPRTAEVAQATLVDVSQLEATIETWWANDPQFSTPHCVAQVEIDNFRQVTSEVGSAVAAQLASQIENRLLRALRQDDLVATLGGSRFLVLFPKTESAIAAELLNTIRNDLSATEFVVNQQVIRTTLTAGVTGAQAEESIEDFMHRAATALNHARRNGKNQIAHHDGQQIITLEATTPQPTSRTQVPLT
jgi:diguanylate cyclase (GGDEF)-like protein